MKKENKRARCSLTVWEQRRRINFSRQRERERERESYKSWKWGSRKEIKKRRKEMRRKEIKRGERCLKNVWNNESLFLLSFSRWKVKIENREREREKKDDEKWEERGRSVINQTTTWLLFTPLTIPFFVVQRNEWNGVDGSFFFLPISFIATSFSSSLFRLIHSNFLHQEEEMNETGKGNEEESEKEGFISKSILSTFFFMFFFQMSRGTRKELSLSLSHSSSTREKETEREKKLRREWFLTLNSFDSFITELLIIDSYMERTNSYMANSICSISLFLSLSVLKKIPV